MKNLLLYFILYIIIYIIITNITPMPIIDTAQYASATKLKTHTREVIENTHKF